MLPAPGDTSWLAAVVERERSVAGDVLWRNGHMVLDCRKRASMMEGCAAQLIFRGLVTADRRVVGQEGRERRS